MGRTYKGYLGDIGLSPSFDPMDFAGWFEAFLDGRWYTFDLRNNVPRIGRILIARGRDAVDVAISTTFGPNSLVSFRVTCDFGRPVMKWRNWNDPKVAFGLMTVA